MSKPKDPEVVDEMEAAASPATDEAREAEEPESADADGTPTTEPVDDAEPEAPVPEAVEVVEARATAEQPPHVGERTEEHGEEHAEEHGHRSLAATTLMILVGVIAVAAGALWAAPRVAPHLPAAVAHYLMPGQFETAAEIAALRQSLNAATGQTADRIAALEARVTAAEAAAAANAGRLDALPDPAPVAADATEALSLAREANAGTQSLLRRADAVQTEMIGLQESLAAINTALAAGRETTGESGGAVPAEISAAVAALSTRIDSLASAVANRAELQDLQARIDAFAARIDALEASAADARDVQSQALGEVSTAIHQASLRSALAALTSQVQGGQPYAAPLKEVAALTGGEPPEALAAGAEGGLATATLLGASFGPPAQAAVAADVRARAGDGTGSQVLGWLRAQVTGRPVTEQEGDSVGAITSRIAARVSESALAEALAAAEALPPHSQEALGAWLDQLRTRVAAERALADWLAKIDVNG